MNLPPGGLRRQPRQARSREMVERIVSAARDVLVKEGFERATTNRVADRAGISPGSLYQYFPDKQAVLDAVIEQYTGEIAQQLSAIVGEAIAHPPEDMMRQSITALVDLLAQHAEYVRLVWFEIPQSRLVHHRRLMESTVENLIGAYLTISGLRTAAEARRSSWTMVRLVEHLCVQWVLEGPAIDREVFVEDLCIMLRAHVGL